MCRSHKITFFLLLATVFLLSACGKPKTPMEVSQAFWQGVINGKVTDVVTYSTLGSETGYEAFSRDWKGMQPSWGKIIIEEHEARVHTHISKPDAAQSEMLYFVTYLSKQGDQWKVDYEKTEKAVLASSAVSDFVNRITTIGDQITKQFDETSNMVNDELGNLNTQLAKMSEQLGGQTSTAVKKYSEIMRQHLDALVNSIEKAINEKESSIDPADRTTLEEAASELGESSKKLAQPDMKSIAETGEVIIITRNKLKTVDAGIFQDYQVQWQQWINEVKADLVNLSNEMTVKVK